MQTQPIPFTGSNKNVDQKFLNGINFTCRNGVVDELGNLTRRPGQSLFVDLGTAAAVTGLFYSAKHNVTIAVSGAQIFTINAAGTATDITGTGTPELGDLVTFADFGDVVYCANGGKIISIPLTSGTTTYLTDSDAPVLVTHVAILNRRLIANNLAFDARFEWADTGDGTVWSGSFATAEAQNDKLLGLYVEDERLMLFGANTLEPWRDNGSTPFVPESQEYVQRGVITKYAPAYCRDRWIWLDEYKQLVMLNGRQAMSIPQQNARGLTKFLQELDLTDARGRYVISAGRFYYLCLLPKAEKSFFYDIDKDEWYEASFWDELNAEDDLYRAFSSTYAFGDSWGEMLIGDSKSGKVFSFDTSAYTDNSETIRTVLTTGYVDRGTSENRKKTARISGRVEISNVTVADPALRMSFKWRNENTNTWSYRPIKLYKLSNNQFRWSTVGLGQYYMRQYELEITSDAPFTMSPMMETYEVVR